MKTKFIEAIEATQMNWGRFILCRFEEAEWAYRSQLDDGRLLAARGWTPNNLLVVDIQTGEGAIFKPGGYAKSDLNEKHQIWVCPLFEPFLTWLYQQNLSDLDALPGMVNLGDVPTALFGHRRTRKIKT